MSLGRNQPCPCGSGRKYKKCCMPKDSEAPGAALPLPEAPFRQHGISAAADQSHASVHEKRGDRQPDRAEAVDQPSPGSNGETIRLLDTASVEETIDRLGIDDLRYLNKLIVERIKFLMNTKRQLDMMMFRPGDRVRFTSTLGEEKIGTVIRINQKTVSVDVDGDTGWWKVSPGLLVRVAK